MYFAFLGFYSFFPTGPHATSLYQLGGAEVDLAQDESSLFLRCISSKMAINQDH